MRRLAMGGGKNPLALGVPYSAVEYRCGTTRRRRTRGVLEILCAIGLVVGWFHCGEVGNKMLPGEVGVLRAGLTQTFHRIRGGSHNRVELGGIPKEIADDYSEYEHYNSVLNSFKLYQNHMEEEISRRNRSYHKLSSVHKGYLPQGAQSLPSKLNVLKKLIRANKIFLDNTVEGLRPRTVKCGSPYVAEILSSAHPNATLSNATNCATVEPPGETSLPENIDKVVGTLHLLARDWSWKGEAERNQSYGAILQELLKRKPVTSENRNRQKVLIPGVGLARLMFDCCMLGYNTEGNEFSYQLLLATNFILNGGLRKEQFAIFPWIDNPSNHITSASMMEPFWIPDVDMAEMIQTAKDKSTSCNPPMMSMTGGEFVKIYSKPRQTEQWDAVISCFFLDAAPNPIEYIETIYQLLKPGGIWINFGPLTYHWQTGSVEDDSRFGETLELTLEEILHVSSNIGFRCVNGPFWQECTYASSATSMQPTFYNATIFTLQK